MLDSNGSFDNPFFQDKKIVKIDCKWKDQEYTKDAFGFTHAEYVCSFILKENPEAEIILVPIVRKNKKSTVLDMIEGIELLIEEQVDMYKLIDIAAKYDTDVLFNIVSPVGRAKDNSEILTDTERIDMNLKILNYMLGKGYENKKIARGFHQRIQVRDSCGGYGKVMAIYPEGDIYMCQCMEKCQFKMGNIIKDTPQKILVRLEEMMNTEEIKKTFCVTYKEICRECDYRYICGGRCLASDEPYDYRCIFIKSMLKYVLFYYNAKEDKRKQLEHYKQYLEQVKEIINQEKKE